MRWPLALTLALVACKDAPARPRVAIRAIAVHAGAIQLDGDDRMLASTTQTIRFANGQRPFVRLSAGPDSALTTVEGVLAGVVGGRAIVIDEVDGETVVRSHGPDGGQRVVGRAPLTSGQPIQGCATHDGGAVLAQEPVMRIVDTAGTRTLFTLANTDHSAIPRCDPARPRVLLRVLANAPFEAPAWPMRMVLVDTATGAVLWEIRRDDHEIGDGDAAFLVDGRVAMMLDGALVAVDQRGAMTPLLSTRLAGADDWAVSGDGRRVAYADQVVPGDTDWSERGCVIRVVDAASAPVGVEVARFAPRCADGSGLRFVGAELWIAPPPGR